MEVARTEGRRLTWPPRDHGVDAVAAAARRVTEAVIAATGSDAELDAIAARLDELADDLEAQSAPATTRMVDMWRGEGFPRHDPATGTENPIAPPLVLEGLPDGSLRGEVILGVQYQGPPGLAHGGVSALLLDHGLGVANGWAGHSGRTASLTIDYHRGLPLYTPVTFTGRQDAVDGRKIWASGELSVDGERCVSARGLFITPRE